MRIFGCCRSFRIGPFHKPNVAGVHVGDVDAVTRYALPKSNGQTTAADNTLALWSLTLSEESP